MKRFNIRLLIALLLSALLGAGGVFLMYRFQLKRGAESLLRRYEEKLKLNDEEEAAAYLGRYVSRKKDDSARWKEYALLQKKRLQDALEQGKFDRQFAGLVYKSMEQAVQKNKDDVELREQAVELSLLMRQYPDAIQYLEKLIASAGDKAKPEWKVQLAGTYEMAGERDKTLPILGELVGWDPDTRSFADKTPLAPHNLEAYTTLAALLMSRNLPEYADEVIETMLERNPDQALAYVQHGQYWSRRGLQRKQDLERDANKAMELDPENIDVLLFAGRFALDNQDFVRAKAIFERCRELFPDRVEPIYGLYQWARLQNKIEIAIDYLNQGIKLTPNPWRIIVERALVELVSNDKTSFEKSLEEIRTFNVPPMYLDLLRGLQKILQEEWLEASKLLAEVRGQFEITDPDRLALIDNYLLIAYERMGQVDRKLEVIERLLAKNPDNLKLRMMQIQTLLEMHQDEKALSQFEIVERAVAMNPQLGKEFLLPRLQLELRKQGRLPEDLREWKRAEDLVEQIQDTPQATHPFVVNLLSSYYDMRGMSDKAQAVRERMSQQMDDGLGNRLNELLNKVTQENLDVTLQELTKLESKHGVTLRTRLVRAYALLKANPENLSALLAEVEQPPESFNDLQRTQLWNQLASYYLMNKRPEDARRLWEQVLAVDRDNVNIRLMLFELAYDSSDLTKVERELKEFEDLFGRGSPEWNWGRAKLILLEFIQQKATTQGLEEALTLISAATTKRENWSPLYELRGDVLQFLNRSDQALASYEKARELGANAPLIFRKLTRLYYLVGNYPQTREALSRFPRELWDDVDKRIDLHLLAIEQKLPEKIDIDEMARDADGFIALGRVLADAGRTAEGEIAFRKAVELAPDSPVAWSGLVTITQATQGKEAAVAVLEEAKTKVDPKSMNSFLAACYRILNDIPNAEQYYLKTLEQSPDHDFVLRDVATFYLETGNSEKARAILERMLKDARPNDPTTPEPVRWARRALAREIARTSFYDDFQKAVELIKQNFDPDGSAQRDDLILWGQLALPRPEPESRQAILDEMERVKVSRKLSPDERMILAQLHESVGNWTECQSLLTDILIQSPNEPTVLDLFLQLLLKHDDLAAAAKWVENCPPNSFAYIRNKAQIDVRRGKTDEVLASFANMVKAPGTPEEQQQRLRLVAGLSEQLAPFDPKLLSAAESAYRRLAAANAQFKPEYLDFMLRHFRPENIDMILANCKELMDSGDYLGAISRALTVFRNNTISPAMRDKVTQLLRGWFEQAEKAAPSNGMLAVQRSEMEGGLGNSDMQKTLLERYLEQNPQMNIERAMVLNNLAYLEALKMNGDRAKQLVDQAISIIGPQAPVRDTLGMAYLALGKYQEAQEAVQYAIDNGAGSATVYFHLAWIQWKAGQRETAAQTLAKALSMGLKGEFKTGLEQQRIDELVQEMTSSGIDLEKQGPTAQKAEAEPSGVGR